MKDFSLAHRNVSCFPNVLLPAAPAFHHVDNVSDLACHIFMHFEVNSTIKFEWISFYKMNAVWSSTFSYFDVNFALVSKRLRLYGWRLLFIIL